MYLFIESHTSPSAPDQTNHETYIPPLPGFSYLTSNARRVDYNATSDTYSKKTINMLIVGQPSGLLFLFAFGVLPCGIIDVVAGTGTGGEPGDQGVCLVDARMSADFRQLHVCVLRQPSQHMQVLTYTNDALKQHLWPLLQLATRHGHILNTMQYIEDIIQCITEAWETALLEMDNMLTRYASAHPSGSVSADFLELLIYGFPSDALEEFLTRDLTEKGLKKLGNSIEISYSTIQKLVIKPLHCGILNVCYHLNDIKGLARNVYYYRSLLGTPDNAALEQAGGFLIKSLELQQTIEQSTRDYKLFWCWLYGVVIRLMDEVVPDDIAAFSQQDIIYLAEFLNNFDAPDAEPDAETAPTGSGDDTPMTPADAAQATPTAAAAATPAAGAQKKRYNLERVGQYLQNEPLAVPTTVDLTQKWHQLLEQNGCLAQCDLIYPHDRSASLLQQHARLKDAIVDLFGLPERMIGSSFLCTGVTDCAAPISAATEQRQLHRRTAHVNNLALGCSWLAMLVGPDEAVIVETPLDGAQRAVKLSWHGVPPWSDSSDASDGGSFGSFGPVMEYRDIAFYNEEWLSMLLFNAATAPGELASNCWLNFPVRSVREYMVDTGEQPLETVSMYGLCDPSTIRRIEHGDAWRMAVSGSRKLVTVVGDSAKRVRVYETEVDEDDEDGLDVSQSSAGGMGGEMSRESDMASEEEEDEDAVEGAVVELAC